MKDKFELTISVYRTLMSEFSASEVIESVALSLSQERFAAQ